jgi:hypothetical protein
VNLKREAVHETRQFDAPVIESADEFGKFFLRSYDQPHLAPANAAQALNQRLEIEHLLDIASDELADLVDYEH